MSTNSERDIAILSDVVRERLTTVDVVHARYFGASTPDAARKVLDRLVADEWLRRIPLHGQTPCYILTFAATYRLRIHRVAAKVPGLPALCRAYALVCFAVRTGARRVPYPEWVGLFPELHRPGLPANSYFLEDSSDGPRVLLVHVDAGQDVRRAVARVRRLVSRRYAIPAFAELIQSGRFELVVLTPTGGKKRALEKAIERRYRGLTPVRVVIIPELEPLVARKLDRRGR
jgi:hypothetical protein